MAPRAIAPGRGWRTTKELARPFETASDARYRASSQTRQQLVGLRRAGEQQRCEEREGQEGCAAAGGSREAGGARRRRRARRLGGGARRGGGGGAVRGARAARVTVTRVPAPRARGGRGGGPRRRPGQRC